MNNERIQRQQEAYFYLQQQRIQMSMQQTNRAVQLIAFDQNKNPYITPQALNILQTMHTNDLYVISVAGKYRTGKSYILNRVLLNRSNGFNVGHTINACTKGLWMWPELIKLDNKDCLIIDTEGLGSLEEGQSTDLKIFLLALLFSSKLIYNSTGNIDEQALQSLSLVIQLANVLQRQDKYDTQELVNTFPSFLWLLRDFSLKIQDEKGQKMTTGQYLEQALRHQPRTTQAAQRKNQIRKQLRTFFSDRDCFALVRPTEEQKDLQNLSSLDEAKLRPEFINLIATLRKKLQVSIKPKKVKGRNLSVAGFVELCQYYTKALVDGKLPTISSHWDNLCLGQTHRIFQKFQLEHLRSLESEQNSKLIEQKHKEIIKNGLQAIDKSFLGKLQKQLFKERFQRKLQSQLKDIKNRINSIKGRQLKVKLETLQQKSQTLTIIQRYESIIIKMSEISENINKDEDYYCEFYLYLCQYARNLIQQAQNQRYLSLKISNQKQNYQEMQINSLKEQISKKQIQFGQNIKEISQNNQQRQNNQILNQIIQGKQQQIIKLINKNEQQSEMMNKLKKIIVQKQDQLYNMKKELQTIKQRQKQSQDIRNRLQRQLLQKNVKLNYEQIKIRKINREKDILKNRYEIYLQENIKLKNEVDSLENKLNQLQRKQLKKCEQGQFKIELQKIRYNYIESCQQNKQLLQLINEQKNIYDNILQIPKNINHHSFNKKLQIEISQKKQIEDELNYVSMILNSYRQFQCKHCNHRISLQNVKTHAYRCSLYSLLEIDISYKQAEGCLIFIFQVEFGKLRYALQKNICQINEMLKEYGCKEILQPTGEEHAVNGIVGLEQARSFIQYFFYKQRENILNNNILYNFLSINHHLSQFLYEN